MTRDQIIAMAREAGFEQAGHESHAVFTSGIERFASLVEAAAIDRAHKGFCSQLRQLHDSYALASHPGGLRARGQS